MYQTMSTGCVQVVSDAVLSLEKKSSASQEVKYLTVLVGFKHLAEELIFSLCCLSSHGRESLIDRKSLRGKVTQLLCLIK